MHTQITLVIFLIMIFVTIYGVDSAFWGVSLGHKQSSMLH